MDSKVLVLINKGETLSLKGRYSEAIDCFDAVLKIEPKYVFALENKDLILTHKVHKEMEQFANLSDVLKQLNEHKIKTLVL